MKKISYSLFAILFALAVNSCSNDFELTADWKDIPIVYGFLSRADTAQYIRVEKAFLDPSTSALEIAKNPDSLYYDNISVKLIHTNSTGDNLAEYSLHRVDGNEEGYPREDGVFADSPNYLYKILTADIDLVENALFELRINRGDDLSQITSQTRILNDVEIASPVQGGTLNWAYDSPTKFKWRYNNTNTFIFNLTLFIHYEEEVEGTSNFEPKVLRWDVRKNIVNPSDNNPTFSFKDIEGLEFYKFMASNIEGNLKKKFKEMEVLLVSGGKEVQEFVELGGVNTGLTSSQEILSYSNLSEGFGVFSARDTTVIGEVKLHSNALDSLKNGIYTKDLNFR